MPEHTHHQRQRWLKFSREIKAALRERPRVRCLVYFGGVEASKVVSGHLYPRDRDWEEAAFFLTSASLIIAWTGAFARLHKDDLAHWFRRIPSDAPNAVALGLVLGAGTWLAVAGIATAAGWAQFPAWGWERIPPAQLLRGVVLTSLQHAAIAWSEELAYRGYGLDTAARAIGRPTAIAGVALFFAAGHGFRPLVLIGQSALGFALTALRFHSGTLWMSVGYHFGWNVIQTTVFGPPELLPSLRPMHVEGPELWIGRPGYPVPGMLMAMVNLAVACIAGFSRGRQRSHL